jgi:GNAT superfamily N-acetyltransferase
VSYEVRLVTPEDRLALEALFERDHSPCYCRYWHFTGTNKEWEARCAFEPHENRAELAEALETRSEQAIGLIARATEPSEAPPLIGWMKLIPQRALPKLLARSPYKNLETPDVFSIGCFLIDPAHRRRGVARALVEAAITVAPTLGARYLEAYPRVFEGMHDAEQWTGPFAMFESLGFEVVRDQPQYPVVRRRVG